MKTQFLKYGLDSFEDHNVFELLLFFSVPRSDTNKAGHGLVDKFGSFNTVMDADFDELLSVDGIGESSAAFIKLVHAMGERYISAKSSHTLFINDSDDALEYLKNAITATESPILAVCMDGKGALIRSHEIYPDEKESITKKVVRAGLFDNALSVIIAARYSEMPQEEFECCVERLQNALPCVGIGLADAFAFTQNGLIRIEI